MKISGEGSLFKQFRPWGRRKNKAKRDARAHLIPYDPEAEMLVGADVDIQQTRGE